MEDPDAADAAVEKQQATHWEGGIEKKNDNAGRV